RPNAVSFERFDAVDRARTIAAEAFPASFEEACREQAPGYPALNGSFAARVWSAGDSTPDLFPAVRYFFWVDDVAIEVDAVDDRGFVAWWHLLTRLAAERGFRPLAFAGNRPRIVVSRKLDRSASLVVALSTCCLPRYASDRRGEGGESLFRRLLVGDRPAATRTPSPTGGGSAFQPRRGSV